MRAILFDFGGTIDSDGTPWRDRFYSLYKDEGIDSGEEAFAKAFYASDDNLASRFNLAGRSLAETVDLQVRCVFENLAPQRMESAAKVAGRFLEDCRAQFRRNRPILERLSKRFKLGVVSNFYGNLESALGSEGLGGLFAVIADSSAVGVSKPGAGLFLHATKSLAVEPGECLMVGDSIARDMRGAEALNMPHALLSSGGAACCAQARVVGGLAELEASLS